MFHRECAWSSGRLHRVTAILAALVLLACALLVMPTRASADPGEYVIEVAGGEGDISHSSDDLFSHIPAMVPGRTYAGSVELRNSSGADAFAFLFVDDWAARADLHSLALLDEVQLTVSYEGETVYAGTLRATELQEICSLGLIGSGSSAHLTYCLTVPSDLSEPLYGLENAVRWHVGFWGGIADGSGDSDAPDEGDETEDASTEAIKTPWPLTALAQTGDEAPIALLAVALISALVVVALAAGEVRISRKGSGVDGAQ